MQFPRMETPVTNFCKYLKITLESDACLAYKIGSTFFMKNIPEMKELSSSLMSHLKCKVMKYLRILFGWKYVSFTKSAINHLRKSYNQEKREFYRI